jgi:hypothetical protein
MKHWKDNLKVGDRIVNKHGKFGTVTWASGGFSTYKLDTETFDGPYSSCDIAVRDNLRLATALSKLKS